MVVASTLVHPALSHVPDPQEFLVAPSTEPTSREAQRERRAERLLDAAGELLVAWGYPKITIEDVARRAGVGKGTVYLHFPTKEVLFLAVVLRAQTAVSERLLESMARSPEGIWPSELARTIYKAQGESPVVQAITTGTDQTLGTFAQAAAELFNEEHGTDVEVQGWDGSDGLFTGDFDNVAEGRNVTDQLLQAGADIILPVAGPVGEGTATAIEDFGSGLMIWVDTDGVVSVPQYSSILLTSVMKNMDVAVFDAVQMAAEDQWEGGLYVGTLENEGVGIAPFHELEDVIMTPHCSGWTEGLQLMREGSTYEFFIPAELGYGNNPPPNSPIAPGAVLIFEVELIAVVG
jgi:AcrR family transcriptional regulator